MRKLARWGGWAVLLLALGAAAASAGPPADDDDDPLAGPNPTARPRDGWNPFLSRLLGQDSKKPAPKAAKDKDKKPDAAAPAPTGGDFAARVRALEMAKLRRRQDVCERLRDVARQSNDEELERKAIQLDALAFEVYQERTLRLAGGASETAEVTEPVERANKTEHAATGTVREVRP